jgi:hypothetical protein
MRGVLLAAGVALGLGALAAANVVSPRECATGPGPRSQFTSETMSLIAIGGLIILLTVVLGLTPRQRTRLERTPFHHALILALAVVVTAVPVGISVIVLDSLAPYCY